MQSAFERELAQNRRKYLVRLKLQGLRQIFVIMGIVFMLIFSYIPMVGIIIAFKDYKLATGFTGFFTSKWAGFSNFIEFFHDRNFGVMMRNTIVLSLLKLVFTFPLPIIFAIAINEIRNSKAKKIVQTISYLPHFISWVIVAGLIFSFLNGSTGLINQFLMNLGVIHKSIPFLSNPKYFWPIAVISDMWKGMGWWAIIFMAAITGVDVEIYEAAIVDGASRIQRINHITLPSIKSTIVIVLIMSLGNLLGGGMGGSNFDQCYLLGNSLNSKYSEIIETYVLTMGLAQGRYSYAAAVGLFQSIISLVLIYSSNFMSEKLFDVGLF
jgi:putative aldouronate transport system permease protein